ncbi:cytochrome P450 3A13-like [Haliotis rufescens]|uniref:cytochrome P450 3A13-like n=1 Tax=Haliotis rufescens TaxID=6454 RepID=UPI00201F2B77|nr:cytochrome P450 3A13-like [Haliotis rufescens]
MEILGLVDVPLYLLLVVVAAVLIYLYGTSNYDYFKKLGIPGPTSYPFIGCSIGFTFYSKFYSWKQQYGSVFGIFMGKTPALVISDLDILKEVLVKSFNTFRNRMKITIIPYPFNLAVFFLDGAHWKRVRSIISPSFSSAKLRLMGAAINDCAMTLSKNFSKVVGKNEAVNMKKYFSAYTIDVISRTAFGIKIDSQNDFDNPFVANAKEIFQHTNMRRVLPIIAGVMPRLARALRKRGFGMYPQRVMSFFQRNVTEMIKQRQNKKREKQKQRIDFLQLLVDAEIEADSDDIAHAAKGQISESDAVRRLSTDEIVGQSIVFFSAGYEATASTLTFASYSLAVNPDVQEKAYNEITEMLGNEEPNYDNIQKLKYLDNILTETLRLYPPVITLHRRASETIQIKGLTIPKGQTVFIPVFALQRDPQLFKDPESFKPERHDEKSNPLSFLAFGYGPRKCIGMRLALVKAKIALVHVLRTVKFERTPDTPEVLTFKETNFLRSEKDITLKLSSRC